MKFSITIRIYPSKPLIEVRLWFLFCHFSRSVSVKLSPVSLSLLSKEFLGLFSHIYQLLYISTRISIYHKLHNFTIHFSLISSQVHELLSLIQNFSFCPFSNHLTQPISTSLNIRCSLDGLFSFLIFQTLIIIHFSCLSSMPKDQFGLS